MDLTEQQAEALFPDEREDVGLDAIEDHYMTLDRRGSHLAVIVGPDEDEYVLSNAEQESVMTELGCETIWGFLTDSVKTVEAIRVVRDDD